MNPPIIAPAEASRYVYRPYAPIPDHWKRPAVKFGPTGLADALIDALGGAQHIIVEAPEFDPFIRGASTGHMRRLREMRMIESVGPCRHRLTPFGRAVRNHLLGSKKP